MADLTSQVASRKSQVEIPADLSRRVIIDRIRPEIDGGRFPIKRTVGERVEVTATIFADGHDVIAAVVRDRYLTAENPENAENGVFSARSASSAVTTEWHETPMTLVAPGTDEWTASFEVGDVGWHEYQVIAWIDRFLTWRRDLDLKAAAGQDVSLEELEGSHLLGADADRARATASEVRRVWVDRERARFGAWYEMFPRSAGPDPSRSATFREAATALPRIADLGFDVVYLPPIHPIGTSFRKGANNALAAGPEDPGSPWAIGSPAGGHTAVEPGLGTIEDFDAFLAEASRLGLELALDLAWQCSPDHPWVREHPEWFRHRPDGTIKYAENPPKKYQDIYPFDFESAHWRALWEALLDVTVFWIRRGVRIFRVDNPHTKTFGFWEWMIDRVHASYPDVIFLAEAFTRPALMRYLAKAGFTQSYSYFTWRNTKQELVEYFTQLTRDETREYMRPNLFANTPDILHAYLQHGGCAAFQARLLLAATLGASYGIYSGFELCEASALHPGSEEYADSEKYQIRHREWDRPDSLRELIARVNAIRRDHAALHFDHTLQFHDTDNAEIIAYTKRAPGGGDCIMTIVNLDPHHMQHGRVHAPIDRDGTVVVDLVDDTAYTWRRGWNYVRFDPDIRQGHILWLPTPA